MALTQPTAADVKAVIDTSLSDARITALIEDATLIVEGCPVVAGYSSARQAAIIKWVTAHLISTSGFGRKGPGAVTQKAIGDASESYASGQLGTNLMSSYYGQQALMLDGSGCLADLGKRRARFEVL